jgi:hypothetical protein
VKFERPALASTVLTQRSGLDALSLDDLQQLLAMAQAAEAAQRAVIEQQMTDQPPLLVGSMGRSPTAIR